jgi:Transglutaminase-like superfamily
MGGTLLRKTRSFASLPWSVRWLFVEAIFTAAYVKITLLFLPFSKVAGWLGTAHQQAPDAASDKLPLVKNVQTAVKLCDRYTPWDTECYTRSLTGKIMLKRRRLPSTLYFGFAKDEQNKLKGHAWLKCSGIIVTGFCDFSQYTVHSSFS